MNGRVYDPLVGRMISADPSVPDAMNAQAWNRYSYVGNDPLTFTDPSGFSWLSDFFHSIGDFFRSLFQLPILRTIVQIVITAVLTPFIGPVFAAAAGAAVINGLSGGNLSTMLRSAAIAGATALAFWGVGELTGHTPQFGTPAYAANVAGHAGVGCMMSVASGGKCGPGALSGAAGAAASPLVSNVFPDARDDFGQRLGGAAVSGAIGGLASVAGGGKFEDGAVTAAFGYMFNEAGAGPNSRHEIARQQAMLDAAEQGYEILRDGSPTSAKLPGFPTRVYDFVMRDAGGTIMGAEVKTSLWDEIFLTPRQIRFDSAVAGGQLGAAFGTGGLLITTVAYFTYCFNCSSGLASIYSKALVTQLGLAGIPTYPGRRLGQ